MALLILISLLTANFRAALPGYVFTFPRDHGSHPEYRTEWWYFTGHLNAAGGKRFGFELTFFRDGMNAESGNPSRWRVDNLYVAHFAITDIDGKRFQYFEKLNRAGPGIAGAATDTLNAWNENWSARLDGGAIHLKAGTPDAGLELTLQLEKAPVLHGENGVTQKSEGAGHASHYYSQTRMTAKGSLRLRSEQSQVEGLSWMDHEFGSGQLTPNQIGWDWFGIQLDNGEDLMLYRLRFHDGRVDPHSSGTLVGARTSHLALQDFDAVPGRHWKSPRTGADYPVEWDIRVRPAGGELRLTPVLDNQELVTLRSTGIAYWEGAADVKGTWRGAPIHGRAYVEMTGYTDRLRPNI